MARKIRWPRCYCGQDAVANSQIVPVEDAVVARLIYRQACCGRSDPPLVNKFFREGNVETLQTTSSRAYPSFTVVETMYGTDVLTTEETEWLPPTECTLVEEQCTTGDQYNVVFCLIMTVFTAEITVLSDT